MKPWVLLAGDMARGWPSTSSHRPGCLSAQVRNSSTVIGVVTRCARPMRHLPHPAGSSLNPPLRLSHQCSPLQFPVSGTAVPHDEEDVFIRAIVWSSFSPEGR